MTDRQFDRLFERLVVAVERLAGIEQPKPIEGPAEKPATTAMRDRVAVIDRSRPEPETDPLGQGGTPPEEFWRRGDPDAAAMKRPARKMGRPL
jgi:hypothetical protein